MCTCRHVYIFTYIRIHIFTCIHVYVYTCIHIYIYIYMYIYIIDINKNVTLLTGGVYEQEVAVAQKIKETKIITY